MHRPAASSGIAAALSYVAAQPSDARALADLRVLAMRESLERIGRFDPVRARERLLGSFDAACTTHVEAGGRRVGFYVLKPDDGALLLDHLYLHPQAQGLGIGTAVLRRVFACADAERLPLRVGALRGSDANRFYARHGFERVAETEFDIHYVRRPAAG
jgi:GNAT superfamily N-acetyltransferase